MTNISKEDALAICQTCPKKFQKGCIISDIERAGDYLENIPDCMITSFGNERIDNKCESHSIAVNMPPHTNEQVSGEREQVKQAKISEYCESHSTAVNMPPKNKISNEGTTCSHEQVSVEREQVSEQVEQVKVNRYCAAVPWVWDELDDKIYAIINERNEGSHIYNQSYIAKLTKDNRLKVRRRLYRMESFGIIRRTAFTGQDIFYEITPKGVLSVKLVNTPEQSDLHHETKTQQTCSLNNIYHVKPSTDSVSANMPEIGKVTLHAFQFKAEIMKAPDFIPIPSRYYHPKGWSGSKAGRIYEDESPNFKIRSDPKNFHIDYSKEFCGTITPCERDAFLLKMKSLADRDLGRWAEKNHYKIGEVTLNRTPDTVVPELSEHFKKTNVNNMSIPEMGVTKDDSDKDKKGEAEFRGQAGEANVRPYIRGIQALPHLKEDISRVVIQQLEPITKAIELLKENVVKLSGRDDKADASIQKILLVMEGQAEINKATATDLHNLLRGMSALIPKPAEPAQPARTETKDDSMFR